MEKYDIIVIGAGPGGYFAAIKAAQMGARVAMVEKGSLGGACLNMGCIPTKTLYQAAQRFVTYLEFARMLKDPFARKPDLAQRTFSHAMEAKDRVIASLRKQMDRLVKLASIAVYHGSAQLRSHNEVIVNGKEMIYAHTIIIATGSAPIMPRPFDINRNRVMTSNDILALRTLPASMLIIGGGYIGCEYATIFSHFGVKVTLVEQLPAILNTEDEDVVNEVVKSFRKWQVTVHTNTRLEAMTMQGERVHAVLSCGECVTADIVLVAVGRSPNSRGLGLEKLGIQFSEKGAIGVNEKFRTKRDDIYAIGDVIDRELRLAHVSEKEGIIGIDNILHCMHFDMMRYDVIPTAVFVDPEVASVGTREFQLKKQRAEYIVGKSWYARNAMAQCSGNTAGFVKLIAERASGKLFGGTIVGDHAADMIGTIATAMHAGATIQMLAESVWFHPSRPEAIKEAAEAACKHAKG